MPTTGAAATSTGGGGGVCHDIRAFGTVRLANGFAKGEGALGSFDAFVSKLGTDKAFEGMPAFRRAILVVSFANISNELSSSGGWQGRSLMGGEFVPLHDSLPGSSGPCQLETVCCRELSMRAEGSDEKFQGGLRVTCGI